MDVLYQRNQQIVKKSSLAPLIGKIGQNKYDWNIDKS